MSATHIAGPVIVIDARVIQRCAWCGEKLIDCIPANMMVVEGDTRGVATWPEFALVRVDGNVSSVVETFENRDPLGQLPDDSCKDMVE